MDIWSNSNGVTSRDADLVFNMLNFSYFNLNGTISNVIFSTEFLCKNKQNQVFSVFILAQLLTFLS